MSIILSGITASLDGGEREALSKAKKRLGGRRVKSLEIRKCSVDARKKDNVGFCYSVEAALFSADEEIALANKNSDITLRKVKAQEQSFFEPALSPVIVGFGPAGMFCALTLARAGARPVVLERGADIDTRVSKVEGFWKSGVLDSSTNVQFGEGGAGTFSDGKLTTGINNPLCDSVLEDFVKFGADSRIKTQAHPHIGTDALRKIVKEIRLEIERLGGRVMFNTQMTDIKLKNGAVCAVITDKGEINTDRLVLAIGHSARDSFEMLDKMGLAMQAKAFSAGVRVEQLQSVTNAAMYGKFAGHPALPPAEYKLSRRVGDRGVYSFCMCPGGYVVASASAEGGVVTNGMSYSGRDGKNSNAAIAVSVLPSDFENEGPLAGVKFQERLERKAFEAGGGNFVAPCQTVWDFLEDKKSVGLGIVEPTYKPDVRLTNLREILPSFINDMLIYGFGEFDKRHEGFMKSGVLTGVETRTSSPVRILRGEDGKSLSFNGIYPCGEGAGYAGGIMSAACDGIFIANSIIDKA